MIDQDKCHAIQHHADEPLDLLFWSSFAQMGLFPMGVITTALHIVFVLAQAACLRKGQALA